MMNPPSGDEVEVTLLGRGVGECVVLHLLNDTWMVVDSFVDSESGDKLPAARSYLDSLGVDPMAVSTLVVTHFHTDHYRGIDRLHDYYSNARLMVTDALGTEQFFALYGDEAEPPFLGRLPGTIKRANDRLIGQYTPGLRYLKTGQQVHSDGPVTVLAMSPTDAAVHQSRLELASTMATGSRSLVNSNLRDDNRCSVVLYLNAAGICALLGADLVAEKGAYGWRAVLDDPNHRNLERVDLVKVPHHGGVSAHDDAMWDTLVAGNPVLKVAPYWPSALPRHSDIVRLSHRGAVWQAAPSVSFITDEFGNKVSTKPRTGVIQARRRVGDPAWRVHVVDPAFFAAAGP
jgi:hypothetical protein